MFASPAVVSMLLWLLSGNLASSVKFSQSVIPVRVFRAYVSYTVLRQVVDLILNPGTMHQTFLSSARRCRS
uniref:Secreted protein n=1 Tax=Trichuris muris TaxID=70415 RepID=A0A5S6R171_TRIMR